MTLFYRSASSAKSFTALVFLFFFVVSFIFPLGESLARPNPRYASIVMDAETGIILSQSHADKVLYPASLVKMMTLLLTFEALENKKLRKHNRITISRHAANMIPSKLGLSAGQSIRLEDAIYAIVTKSANDVAVGLAEEIAGSENRFVSMMNKKARKLGMARTHFMNASGLHHAKQVSTARDIAKLSQHLITEYPEYYHYFSTRRFTYHRQTYHNHNRLMGSYKGMDGLKTGYVRTSGFNLAASAVRDNQRLIGIVFGGRTARSRNAHMKTLLDRGFSKMNSLMLASRSVPIPPHKPATAVQLAQNVANIAPAAGTNATEKDGTKWASLYPVSQSNAFSRMIGEGDYDPAVSKRLETGLLAIAALRNTYSISKTGKILQKKHSSYAAWSIQIGAFGNRPKTSNAMRTALNELPPEFSDVAAIIAPLKTKQGWIFRARLSGYSKSEAMQACKYLKECFTVSPQAY